MHVTRHANSGLAPQNEADADDILGKVLVALRAGGFLLLIAVRGPDPCGAINKIGYASRKIDPLINPVDTGIVIFTQRGPREDNNIAPKLVVNIDPNAGCEETAGVSNGQVAY